MSSSHCINCASEDGAGAGQFGSKFILKENCEVGFWWPLIFYYDLKNKYKIRLDFAPVTFITTNCL